MGNAEVPSPAFSLSSLGYVFSVRTCRVADLPAQPGGLPDSSRGSERSADPRKSDKMSRTLEGCQKALLAKKTVPKSR